MDQTTVASNGDSAIDAQVSFNGSAYHVTYIPYHSGLHSLSATLASTGADIVDSPFAMVAYPASNMSGLKSLVSGNVRDRPFLNPLRVIVSLSWGVGSALDLLHFDGMHSWPVVTHGCRSFHPNSQSRVSIFSFL